MIIQVNLNEPATRVEYISRIHELELAVSDALSKLAAIEHSIDRPKELISVFAVKCQISQARRVLSSTL